MYQFADPQLKHALDRRRKHLQGIQELMRRGGGSQGEAVTPNAAFAFWHNGSELIDGGVARVPESFTVGLASALKIGFEVTLLCYKDIEGIPIGVKVDDAGKLLEFERFVELQT